MRQPETVARARRDLAIGEVKGHGPLMLVPISPVLGYLPPGLRVVPRLVLSRVSAARPLL